MTRPAAPSLVPLAVALLALLLLPLQPALAQSMVGRTAPEITVPNGGMFGVTPKTKLSDYRGKVVLVVFWSTKCPHCRTHMALVQRLHTRYKDQGLQVLAVASASHADLRSFMRSKRYTFGAGADPQSLNLHKYGVRTYPATFLVGADGRVKSSQGKLYRAIERELRAAAK